MATTTVNSSTASVLARRASTPSNIGAAIISAASSGAAPADKGERTPICRQHRADCAEQRRHAIEPDRLVRRRHAERLRRPYHGGLQPIDADRLAVAHVVLIADVDIVAGLDHLLGGLGEIGLVAIDRRNLKKTGQESQQRHENKQSRSPPVRMRRRNQASAARPLAGQ